jgi:acyl-CoA synthetase (NDP forming)
MSDGKHFLDSFFYPENVAVVGASNNQLSLNYCLFSNLVNLGFAGNIYPVNPNTDKVLGVKAFHSLKDIPGNLDLVVSAVPAIKTPDVIRECVEKHVRNVVIVSGGFSEIGVDGNRIQDEILRMLMENGIRAIGPNTLSPVNCANNFVISFHRIEKLRKGGVSFIFQSGMYDPRLTWLFDDFHVGVNKILDLGNKMDTNEVDALEYLGEDESTKVIAMHLETIKGDSRKFVQVLKAVARKKPVIILKTGRTPEGAKAAASHTSSIIKGNDLVLDSLIKQSGAIRAQNLYDFYNYTKGFEFMGEIKGSRCAIASVSGGEGVMATDICQQEGLSLAKVEQKTLDKMKEVFPSWEVPVNPFDLGVSVQFGDPVKSYMTFLAAMANDTNVDCILVQLPWFTMGFPVEVFCLPFEAARQKGKTVVIWTIAWTREIIPYIEALEEKHIPVYQYVSAAFHSLAALYRYKLMNQGLQQ